MGKFTDYLVSSILNPASQSTNMENRIKPRDVLHMGKGEYTPKAGQPLGWDYDTLTSVMDSMGADVDKLHDDTQDELLNELEARGASTEQDAIPIIEEFLNEVNKSGKP